jgi:hypothetical protein
MRQQLKEIACQALVDIRSLKNPSSPLYQDYFNWLRIFYKYKPYVGKITDASDIENWAYEILRNEDLFEDQKSNDEGDKKMGMYLVGIKNGEFTEYGSAGDVKAAIEEYIHEGFHEDEIAVYMATELSYNVSKKVTVEFE